MAVEIDRETGLAVNVSGSEVDMIDEMANDGGRFGAARLIGQGVMQVVNLLEVDPNRWTGWRRLLGGIP